MTPVSIEHDAAGVFRRPFMQFDIMTSYVKLLRKASSKRHAVGENGVMVSD